MYFRGLTYSLVLHIFCALLGTNIFLNMFFAQKGDYTQHNAYQKNQFIKLEIGALNYTKNSKQQIELYKDSENYMPEHGNDNPTYGRVISNVLLKKLENYSIDLKDNKVKIILSIDKDGMLLDFELQFSKTDEQIKRILDEVLNSGIKFPPNHDKKRRAKYQVLLF